MRLGNHAQGVAYSAKSLCIPATIVMPLGTPAIKHTNVSRMGSNVVLFGQDFDEAKAECARRAAKYGLANISPFDDPYVIAGQGTIGMELVRQCNIAELEAVFCCVGGGGLVAGVGVYLKRIAPHVKIIGVETYDANAMTKSLEGTERVTLNEVGLFADGAAVKVVGAETYRLCRECVDEVVEITTDEICAAIKDVFLGIHHAPLNYLGNGILTGYRYPFHRGTRRCTCPRWSQEIHRQKPTYPPQCLLLRYPFRRQYGL